MEENKNIGFISFEDGTGNVLKIDLPKSKQKKYRMLTIVSMVGYLDFEPKKTKNGNDKNYGTQTIVEKHKIMNKYFITNEHYTNSEYLYEILDVTLKTVIDFEGNHTSTLTTTKSKGQNKYKLDIKSKETRNLNYDELSQGHKNLLNKIVNEVYDSGKAFASAYKDDTMNIIGDVGTLGLLDVIKSIVQRKMPHYLVAALTLTSYSIKYTPASNMRLYVYNINRKLHGDLTKPIKD